MTESPNTPVQDNPRLARLECEVRELRNECGRSQGLLIVVILVVVLRDNIADASWGTLWTGVGCALPFVALVVFLK